MANKLVYVGGLLIMMIPGITRSTVGRYAIIFILVAKIGKFRFYFKGANV